VLANLGCSGWTRARAGWARGRISDGSIGDLAYPGLRSGPESNFRTNGSAGQTHTQLKLRLVELVD